MAFAAFYAGLFLWVCISLILVWCVLILRCGYVRAKRRRALGRKTVAFLHPECLSGGGGERVLWVAVQALSVASPGVHIVLCASWPHTRNVADCVGDVRRRVAERFHLDIPDFEPVTVHLAHLTEASRYPRLTLLLQAVGSCLLGLDAYMACPADVVIDTANQAFSLIAPKLLGATTVAYVHYPTISTDMLSVVQAGKSQFNNDSRISNSRVLSIAKLAYYRAFSVAYSIAGRAADVCMVNSTWTRGHIASLWNHGSQHRQRQIQTVFPPCDVSVLSALALGQDGGSTKRKRGLIVSVGQFRPEKNHMRQLHVMKKLRHDPVYQGSATSQARLVMVGGARNAEDVARVQALKAERKRLGLEGVVELRVNASWDDLVSLLSEAWAGIHTMRDEHFGISVVELQAAGVIPVAHRSGGVALDIIKDDRTGFLADDEDEYARQLDRVISGDCAEIVALRRAARQNARRFSDAAFAKKFAETVIEGAGW